MTTQRGDVDGALAEHLINVEGRECLASTSGSRPYFQWHRENRFRG